MRVNVVGIYSERVLISKPENLQLMDPIAHNYSLRQVPATPADVD